MMQQVELAPDEKDVKTFPMEEMEKGEVCYCPADDNYVLCVTNVISKDIFLIISGKDFQPNGNSYGHNCKAKVRKLADGESVTVKFS